MIDLETTATKSHNLLTVIMADLQHKKYEVQRSSYGSWHILLHKNNSSDKLVLNYRDNMVTIYHYVLMHTNICRQFDLLDPLSIDKLYITIETTMQLIYCLEYIHNLNNYWLKNEQIIEDHKTKIRLLK